METNYINSIPDRIMRKTYRLSQNDNNREIRCNLHDGSLVKTLTGTESLVLRYKKPDNTVGFIVVANTSSTYVDIAIPNTMTDKAGDIYCKLHVDGIGYKAFLINIEGRP